MVIEASEIRQRLDQLRKIPFVRKGEMLYLQLEHKSFSYRIILGSKKTSSDVSNIDTELVSQVNGRVLSVLVGIGDKVSKGDILMTVESMKMEYPISVTHEAVVTKINVEEGNQVEVGSVLIELDLI